MFQYPWATYNCWVWLRAVREMGSAHYRRKERRFIERIKEQLTASANPFVGSQQVQWYERNLVVGSISVFISLVTTVAAAIFGIRALLWVALPFGIIAAWVISNALPYSWKIKWLLLLLPMTIVLFLWSRTLSTPHSAGRNTYIIRDLGSLGGDESKARGINDNGWIVGLSRVKPNQDAFRAFLWTSEQVGMINLGSFGNYSDAIAINKYGHVVGSTNTNTGGRIYFWSQSYGMRDIGTLGGWGGTPFRLNDRDEVVGVSITRDKLPHAFLWAEAAGMRDLGTLGGLLSEAHGINNNGHVVGVSTTASGQRHAFLWTRERGMFDIGTLGGSLTAAVAINDLDQVAGIGYLPSGAQHAFLWSQQLGMRDLGTLGGRNSSVAALNDSGTVVGGSEKNTTEWHAFVWTAKAGMIDLGTLGGSSSQAAAINTRGQVVGEAATSYGKGHATLWEPPE